MWKKIFQGRKNTIYQFGCYVSVERKHIQSRLEKKSILCRSSLNIPAHALLYTTLCACPWTSTQFINLYINLCRFFYEWIAINLFVLCKWKQNNKLNSFYELYCLLLECDISELYARKWYMYSLMYSVERLRLGCWLVDCLGFYDISTFVGFMTY